MDLRHPILFLKKLSYADMLAGNFRNGLINLTQITTHILPLMPGGMKDSVANIFHLLGNYYKSITPVWSKDAIRKYEDAGVIHDVEDLFTPRDVTKVTGTLTASANYYNNYMWNSFWGFAFLIQRSTEIINRVTSKEALGKAFTTKAKSMGYNVQDPDFMVALQDMSTIATNFGNFQYSKGFKSPIQIDFGAGLVGGLKPEHVANKAFFAPLGELVTQFNTFTLKTWGMASLAWNSLIKGHPSYMSQMMNMQGPDEFRDFLKQLDKESRTQLLRALAYTSLTASGIAATTGLTSIAWQVSPLGQYGGLNPLTPVLKSMVNLTTNLATLNFAGMANTARSTLKPFGKALQRLERGGDLTDMMFSTKSDLEQKRPFGAPIGPIDQLQQILSPDERLSRP